MRVAGVVLPRPLRSNKKNTLFKDQFKFLDLLFAAAATAGEQKEYTFQKTNNQ
jgi:hypothetical protein